jgi:hypothetical protein
MYQTTVSTKEPTTLRATIRIIAAAKPSPLRAPSRIERSIGALNNTIAANF